MIVSIIPINEADKKSLIALKSIPFTLFSVDLLVIPKRLKLEKKEKMVKNDAFKS